MYAVRIGERRGAQRVLVGMPEDRRLFGRPRRGWENNFKCFLENWSSCMNWIDLAENRERWRAVVNAVMNLRVP